MSDASKIECVGLDCHRNFSLASARDEAGRIAWRQRLNRLGCHQHGAGRKKSRVSVVTRPVRMDFLDSSGPFLGLANVFGVCFDDHRAIPDFEIQHAWARRGVAAGRFFLFAALFYLLLLGIGRVAARPLLHLHGFALTAMVGNVEVLLATLLATLVLAKLEGRTVRQFGLGGGFRAAGAGALGVCCGAAMLVLLLLVLRASRVLFFGTRVEFGRHAVQLALLYALLFAIVAVAEETLWRGYALVNLSQSVSFWPAVLILSTLFGLTHLKHGEENPIGILSAIIFGVIFGFSFRWSGSLWFAIGLHASWDYCQSFVFGVPDSGVVVPGRLMKPIITEPTWLTGGAAGPEASALMVVVFGAIILVIVSALKKQSAAARRRLTSM